MHSLEIPDKIQDDIREYLMSVNEYKTQQNEMKDFLNSISPSLKANVSRYIFLIKLNNFIFKDYTLVSWSSNVSFISSDLHSTIMIS